MPLPQTQLVDCSDQASILLHRPQQIRSATLTQPEEILSLVVEVVAEAAATYLVEGQTNRRVDLDLVGALAKRRVTILLVDFLALGREDNKIVHLQAVPRLHPDSLASLRQANLQKQQLDQVKRLVCSAAGAALGPSHLVIRARTLLPQVRQPPPPHQPANPPQISLELRRLLPDHPQAPVLAAHPCYSAVNLLRM